MHAFQYHRPTTTKDALSLASQKGEGRYLAGGQSLVQAMKLRLTAPSDLIDLGSIQDLKSLKVEGNAVVVGAMVRHAEVAGSSSVKKAVPSLCALASMIGDRQVRHMGTMGGSPANNDPGPDHPAAALALNATIVTNKRKNVADQFFTARHESSPP